MFEVLRVNLGEQVMDASRSLELVAIDMEQLASDVVNAQINAALLVLEALPHASSDIEARRRIEVAYRQVLRGNIFR